MQGRTLRLPCKPFRHTPRQITSSRSYAAKTELSRTDVMDDRLQSCTLFEIGREVSALRKICKTNVHTSTSLTVRQKAV